MSDSVINHASGVFAPEHLGELTRVIPLEVVDAALAMAGGKERRVRRLPSWVVIYVLLAGSCLPIRAGNKSTPAWLPDCRNR